MTEERDPWKELEEYEKSLWKEQDAHKETKERLEEVSLALQRAKTILNLVADVLTEEK